MATIRFCIINQKNLSFFAFKRNYSDFAKKLEYRKCYKLLNISEDSDQEQIRKAYLTLVKKYHPDSGSKEADALKFHEIDTAFKTLINKKSLERWDVAEEQPDIKHTAPQHRQYLSYEGIGTGTPSQRQKQYSKARAIQAAENVLQHRISKVSAEDGALLNKTPAVKHKIKTKYGFDRLVEDLIQESMSKGEFSNLKGFGKPLKDNHGRNPYVDFTTHKLNEVLIDNGFSPEWITLQKEIREEIEGVRNSLNSHRSYLGAFPLSSEDQHEWSCILVKYLREAEQINKKIDQFNLVVPILNKQMLRIDLGRIAESVLVNGESNKKREPRVDKSEEREKSGNVFEFIGELFKK